MEKENLEKLSDLEYDVLIERGTEPPGSGDYLKMEEEGIYCCKVCGTELFNSNDKFKSDKWPSFKDAIDENIELVKDNRHGMNRTEALCGECGSHLGHLFLDGPEPTGKRFCINSVSLDLERG